MNEFSDPSFSSPLPSPATASTAPTAEPDSTDALKNALEKTWTELKPHVDQLWDEAKKYAVENPGKALLGALGAGVALGYLFRN